MNKEIEELILKAQGFNKEALKSMLFLAKIYTYGLYGEKIDLKKAVFWTNKAINLEQRLSRDIFFSHDTYKKDNIKFNRFNNIQNNIKFIGTKDVQLSINKGSTNRFKNIQHNLRFVSKKNIT